MQIESETTQLYVTGCINHPEEGDWLAQERGGGNRKCVSCCCRWQGRRGAPNWSHELSINSSDPDGQFNDVLNQTGWNQRTVFWLEHVPEMDQWTWRSQSRDGFLMTGMHFRTFYWNISFWGNIPTPAKEMPHCDLRFNVATVLYWHFVWWQRQKQSRGQTERCQSFTFFVSLFGANMVLFAPTESLSWCLLK